MNSWNLAIASLIRYYHDINFILSSIKVLALIHHITNYLTKSDCSQYQRVISVARMRKAFDNHDTNIMIGSSNYTLTFDKYALKAFNQLFHDREISRLLVTSYLLNLPDHYSLKAIIKTINITILQAKLLLILNGKNFNKSDDIVHVDGMKIRPYLMYKHYAHRDSAFDRVNIFKYL